MNVHFYFFHPMQKEFFHNQNLNQSKYYRKALGLMLFWSRDFEKEWYQLHDSNEWNLKICLTFFFDLFNHLTFEPKIYYLFLLLFDIILVFLTVQNLD